MSRLIMVRHGESKWNKLNLFTGWVDIPLSEKGIQESLEAGKLIRDIPIDLIVTSTLIRAQMTAMLAMSQHKSGKVPVILHQGEGKLEEWGKIFSEHTTEKTIPVIRCWELNERMYGELQGLDKTETARQFGADQVKLWRRSYDVAPPGGESLAMTAERSIPYFQKIVIPLLKQGLNVFISAHGNSLRSIIMLLDKLTGEEVVKLEIGTGIPIIYHYSKEVFTKETGS
jgi:2,3-bisphosphoglycerate-dependent phosphoglycerate mutase